MAAPVPPRNDQGRTMLKRILNKIRRMKYRPAIEVEPVSGRMRRLGTAYGGKTFADDTSLYGATIISAGLGEDASFDVEFAKTYGAKVIIVDPTPRSIAYHDDLLTRAGKAAELQYGTAGRLPLESYDLVGVSGDQLPLVRKALWVNHEKQRFYAPRNPEHVSHSIVNFQNEHREDTDYIEVESTTLEALLSAFEIGDLPLLKMDIEGAEIAVIGHMLSESSIRPKQICVEFDELAIPSLETKHKYELLDEKLRAAGYKCTFFDGHSDYSYMLA